jgi:hypothetical protein
MKVILFSFLAISSLNSLAQVKQVKSFSEVWMDFQQKSLKQKAGEFARKTHQISLERAERHWLPRAYVTGQWFNTNDPSQVFFQNLGQRSVEQTDFIPQELNHPERNEFKMMSLGFDFPLFEGGLRIHQSSMFQALLKASELEIKAKRSEDYSELGKNYADLLITSQKMLELSELNESLQKVIRNYQVGSKSNPVGYSGLLGLRGVENRIKGVMLQMDLKRINAKDWITQKAQLLQDWGPEQEVNLRAFLKDNFSVLSYSAFSSFLLSQEEKLKTLDEMKEMEKARFLPRIGLFAQENIYQGDRNTANSSTFGLYIQWDLFNSDSFGRVSEAGAKALTEKTKLAQFKQEEKIMLSKLTESKIALEKSLDLLDESDRLLKEQSLNAMKLFRSGMLNALQLAEVINRRADLIESKFEAESKYIEITTGLYQINN